MLMTASIVLSLSPIEMNCCFGVGIEIVSFARAIDLYHTTSDARSRGGTNKGEKQRVRNTGFFENASTLEVVWSDLKLLVPNRATNGYIEPEAVIVEDFERIVLDMLTIGHGCFQRDNEEDYYDHDGCLSAPSSCESIDLRSLKGKYRIGTFLDGENGRNYCILATASIVHPWGNVFVDLDISLETKNLSFDCPHPKFDAETGEQGIRMLKGTRARSWIVSGSHRMANNNTLGTCQTQYYPSDAAHSIDTCFLAAVAAVKFYYESVIFQDYTSVQLHGMGKGSCGSIDTFFSHGSCSDMVRYDNGNLSNSGTEEKIDVLSRIAQAHPSDNGNHAIAGRHGGTCKLCGSTNIQGRLINGVARKDLCDTFASSYNGRFIQIEQKRDYRRNSFARFWNEVFNEAYPQFLALASTPNANGSGDENEPTSFEDEGLYGAGQECSNS